MDEPAPNTGNIVLTGFMGTGKSSVGRRIAEKLGREFVDTDELIEDRHGPITGIFATRGEDVFREMERGLAYELADRDGLVISTGGRMMLDPDNVEALARDGQIFCLVATTDEILDRVRSDSSRPERPLLQVADPRARIDELLAERERGYAEFRQVVTTGQSIDDVVAELMRLVRGPTAES
ncbi:MAG: shikimate kinase [Acidimicrobiales bacterium]